MADGGQGSEVLENVANGPATDEAPGPELLEELPVEFQQGLVDNALSNDAVEPQSAEEAGEEPAVEEPDDLAEEDPAQEEAAPKGSRAQQRIRQLAQAKKELQAKLDAQTAQYQQQVYFAQQQAQQQYQQQVQAMQQSQKMLEQQLHMLRSKEEAEAEAKLSPMEQYERKLLRDAEARARKALEPEINGLKEALHRQEQVRQQALEQIKRQRMYEHYTGEAARLRQEVFLKDVDVQTQQELGDQFDEMLLAYSAAFGMEPRDAAPQFQQFLNKYVQADLKRRSAKNSARMAQTRGTTAGTVPGRTAAGSRGMPSQEQVRAGGFNTHFDWIAAGEPPLPPVPKR